MKTIIKNNNTSNELTLEQKLAKARSRPGESKREITRLLARIAERDSAARSRK